MILPTRACLALLVVLARVTVACNSATGLSSSGPCAFSPTAATVRATDDFAFTSDSVTVTVGQAVCWENAGRQIYTVTDTGTSGCRFDTPTRTAHLDQGPSGSSD